MGKEADFLFTITVGMPFWGSREHEPLIIALFIIVVSCRNWRGTWTIIGSDWISGTSRYVDFEFKREWEQPGPVQMEGKLRQVSEEASDKNWNIMQNVWYWTQ